ncbi:MAG: hypothetical protein QCI38_03895 [Candidatus Thermoplasmatota archaeon]|nr:hypothetical protein [Candidatus Thermoplasmatota archaeon]
MKKGFWYVLEDEKLEFYMGLTTEEKLTWLEEINEFNRMALGKEEREIQRKLLAGEI